MNRRTMILSSLASPLLAETIGGPQRQWYDLRRFHLRNGSRGPRMMALLEEHWLPAAQRVGMGPTGCFLPVFGEGSPSLWMVTAFASANEAATGFDRLMEDVKFAAAYRAANTPEPAFERMESSLLRAFPAMPQWHFGEGGAHAPRIFELRTYESNSMATLKTKIEMFGNGEIEIFRKNGLNPVFFGENVYGRNLPSLTYLLSYDDMAAHDKAWKAFGSDPEWQKLRSRPGYSDAEIVSSISNTILRPAAFSQIR